MQAPREKLIGDLESYSREIFAGESPFYETLVAAMAADVREGGPVWALLERYASEPATEFFPLRALAGVHHMVLAGELPELEVHYPSVGGDGDAAASWPGVRDALAAQSPEVLAELHHPLQTNETSRCGALIGGLLVLAREHALPLRLLELGASAGLNLHLDRYRYESGGLALGPPDCPVRFVDYWRGGTPPLDAELEVAERRGCDLNPIDAGSQAGQLTLLSYLMPDDRKRLAMLRAALAIAGAMPVEVDRAGADGWVAEQLERLPEGRLTVVFHSIFWRYPPEAVRAGVSAAIEAAAERATRTAPLAWLRYEEAEGAVGRCELRLRSWPGDGEDRLLARGRQHYAPIDWLG